jgi:cytoskeletal protein CcmA (bactofilin family)
MWRSKRAEAPSAAKLEVRNLQTNRGINATPGILKGMAQKDQEPVLQTGPSGDNPLARLGPTVQVKGEISGGEDLLIDGLVEGSVRLEGWKLSIGSRAKVTADIVAGELVVSGYLKGNVSARRRVEIKKDGSMIGDLNTAQITIEDGAYFKGSIEIDKVTAKESDVKREPAAGTSMSVRPLSLGR